MEFIEIRNRHEARRGALQTLYAIELSCEKPGDVCDDLIGLSDDRYTKFARNLVLLASSHKARLDVMIKNKAQRWDFDRIALLDRLTLRLALAELFYIPDVPPKVTLNEGIELAKVFSTDQSCRFVNGILDAIYNEHEVEIRKIKKLDNNSPDRQQKKRYQKTSTPTRPEPDITDED